MGSDKVDESRMLLVLLTVMVISPEFGKVFGTGRLNKYLVYVESGEPLKAYNMTQEEIKNDSQLVIYPQEK